MIGKLLSQIFKIKKKKNIKLKAIKEIKKPVTITSNIHTNKDQQEKKAKLIKKLLNLYQSGEKNIIIKEKDLEKIPISILQREYEKELEKLTKLKTSPKTKQKEQNNKYTNIKKGKDYEKQIGKYFENLGYIIKYNGIEKGKKDDSIDLIAIKKDEVIFIQCKNWKENPKYTITLQMIKAFIGDTYKFLLENPQYKEYKIKRLFVISNKILDKKAYWFIKNNQKLINYKLIKYEKIS